MGLVLGQDTLAQRRAVALQRYFQGAVARPEVGSARGFVDLLGLRPPNAVSRVEVSRWLPACDCVPGTASVELQVALGAPARSGPVEEVQASVWLLVGASPALSRGAPGQALRVEGLPCGEMVAVEVYAANCAGTSPAAVLQLDVPGKRTRPVLPGSRVRAVWAGDGACYDAVVKSLTSDGSVVLNWLRPIPLSEEVLRCVCEAGGDDTSHRVVPRALVMPLGVEPESLGGSEPLAVDSEADATVGDEAVAEPRVDLAEAEVGAGMEAAIEEKAALEGCALGSLDEQVPVAAEATHSLEEQPAAGVLPGAAADPAAAAPAFRLGVRLSDGQQVEELRWCSAGELPERVDEFLAATRLKPVFREPVLRQAELMVQEGQLTNTIDVVDLL